VLTPFPAGERGHVPVIVGVAGDDLARTAQGGRVELAVYVYALDDDGLVRDFVTQNAAVDLAQVGDRLRAGGFRLAGDLLLAPGRYRVRSLVLAGPAGNDYALEEVALEVPDFGTPGASSLPVAATAMTEGVVVRAAASAQKTAGLPFRFAVGDRFVLPEALAVATAGDVVEVLWQLQGLGAGELTVHAELVAADGTSSGQPAVRRLERLAPEPGQLERLWLGVALEGARPGDQVLRLRIEQGDLRFAGELPVRIRG
jgi:hypothetical protein